MRKLPFWLSAVFMYTFAWVLAVVCLLIPWPSQVPPWFPFAAFIVLGPAMTVGFLLIDFAFLALSRRAGDPEKLARRFHETYERLAPRFGYETREESAVPWEDVPEKNKALMVEVCAQILDVEGVRLGTHARP